jgi:hypothetical protein
MAGSTPASPTVDGVAIPPPARKGRSASPWAEVWRRYRRHTLAVVGTEAEASYVIAFDDDLEISPVPFDDRLRIRSRRSSLSIGVVRLHTAEGKLLSEAGTTRGMAVLETTGLPRGVYVVEVRFTDGTVRRRRVVK